MCRSSEYPPYDGEEVGAMLRAQELEDVAYDPHEDHVSGAPSTAECEKCTALAERAWALRYE